MRRRIRGCASLVEREKLMPQALLEARKNLKNPPKIFTEIALEQIDGDVSFFQNDVPSAFFSGVDGAEVATDAASKAEFAKTNAAVIAALKSYGAWMKSDLLPRSNGDYRLGADTFAEEAGVRRDGGPAAGPAAADCDGRSA